MAKAVNEYVVLDAVTTQIQTRASNDSQAVTITVGRHSDGSLVTKKTGS